MIMQPHIYFPDSTDPDAWGDAVGSFCSNRSLVFSSPSRSEALEVIDTIRDAIANGKIQFMQGDVRQAVEFSNRVLKAVQILDYHLTAWDFAPLCPASVFLFVQPNSEDQFGFQPMFTL
jgi:hypothetical protein